VALVGACLMVASGALPLAEAYKAVDLDTLTLLLGMMIVVANLRLSGFFTQASSLLPRDRDAMAVAVTSAAAKRFNPLSLGAVNFLLADVRGALGPYLNVFLVTRQHWSLSEVGLVTTIGGLLGLAAQTPIGAAIDETRAKRGAIVLALAVLGFGAAVIFALPSFWPVLIANCLVAIVGDVFGPAVAAVTLGL
jgi:hypothetical protein